MMSLVPFLPRHRVLAQLAFCAAVSLVAACSVPPDVSQQNFVPILRVLDETEDRPWECAGYSDASVTCAVVSTMNAVPGGVRVVSQLALDRSVTLTVTDTLRAQNGQGCTDSRSAQVSVQGLADATLRRELEEVTLEVMRSHGTACVSYFRSADGFTVTSRLLDGSPIPDQPDLSVIFLKTRPDMRVFDPGPAE